MQFRKVCEQLCFDDVIAWRMNLIFLRFIRYKLHWVACKYYEPRLVSFKILSKNLINNDAQVLKRQRCHELANIQSDRRVSWFTIRHFN